mgnify:CR=1 FL=1
MAEAKDLICSKLVNGEILFNSIPSSDAIVKMIDDEHDNANWELESDLAEKLPTKPTKIRDDWQAKQFKGWNADGQNSPFYALSQYESSLKALKEALITINNPMIINGIRYQASENNIEIDDDTLLSDLTKLMSDGSDAKKQTLNAIETIKNACKENIPDKINDLYMAGLRKTIALMDPSIFPSTISRDDLAAIAAGDVDADNVVAEQNAATDATQKSLEATAEVITQRLPKDFREQCIFLAQIFQFAEFHQSLETGRDTTGIESGDQLNEALRYQQTRKRLPYARGNESNASIVIEGEPYGFINKLTQYGSMTNFFEATNDQLAHLQPMMRLFKVVPKEDGKGETQIEFPFDTFARKKDVEDVFNRKNKRGFGVGIKSFNFTFDGSNPFSVKKSIKASLTIQANNFSELLDTSRGMRYIDLALKTGKSIKKITGNSELDFRLKAVVGLSVPDGHTTERYKEIEEGVKNNFVTLSLTPVTHTFDFDETGAVTFKIEYYAYIEEYFDKARMNIFANTEINERVIQRRLAIKSARLNCKEEDQVNKLNEFIETDGEKVKEDKIKSLQFLSNEMLTGGLIYFLNLTTDQFKQMIKSGPFYDIGDIKDSITSVNEGLTSEKMNKDLEESFSARYDAEEGDKGIENAFKLSGIDSRQFAFFFLGDLLDLILKKIGDNLESISLDGTYEDMPIDEELLKEEQKILTNSKEQFKKFRLVLGPVEIVDHRNNSSSAQVSFADLPVSLAYFNEWLTSKLLAKDSAVYPLTQFLNDLMNDFVRNYLNDDSCYNYNIKQKVRLFQSVITSYKQTGQEEDDITSIIKSPATRLKMKDVTKQPVLNISGHRNFNISQLAPDRENNFFIFYAGRAAPKDKMLGNRETDQKNGIFHYILGRDRGIVKTIKLNKTDSPGLKEVRFEQEGYDGLEQLREIYDVDINTFCNIQAFPGTYIFVEPRGFSPSLGEFKVDEFDLTDLGIGGYYMIINSTHEFAPGVMNSSIKAKWVQSLDAAEEEKQNAAAGTSGNGGVTKKCGIK